MKNRLPMAPCQPQSPEAKEQLISVRSLGERWSYHPESVRRMIRERRIPAVRIGGQLRIKLSDVVAHEKANRVGWWPLDME